MHHAAVFLHSRCTATGCAMTLQLVVGLTLRKTVPVEFVVEKVAVRQISFRGYCSLPCQYLPTSSPYSNYFVANTILLYQLKVLLHNAYMVFHCGWVDHFYTFFLFVCWHGYVLHEGITYKSRVSRTSQMTSRLLRHTAVVMPAHNVLCNSFCPSKGEWRILRSGIRLILLIPYIIKVPASADT
jgi:hypothetical protein